jgi:XTP/dITP diphosphohydrolase
VFSARWSGKHGDDDANLDLLLAQLGDVPPGKRAAHFACAAALALPGGGEHVVHGRWTAHCSPSGAGPTVSGTTRSSSRTASPGTTAEMPPDEKDAISHRGRAFRALAGDLPGLLRQVPDPS